MSNVDELPPEPNQVIISPSSTNQSLTIAQGESQQFTATAVYPNRTVDITNDVVWQTGNINVAVVDTASKGLVKGKAPGQSYIWFYYNINGKTMQPSPASLLTVTPPKMKIELTYSPTKFSYRDVISLKAICKYGDPTIPDENVTTRTKYTIDTPGMFQSQNLSIVYPYIGDKFWPTLPSAASKAVTTIYATYLTQYGTIASGSVAISMDGYTPPKNPRAPGYSQLYQYTGWDTNPPDDNNWANYLYANHTADEPVVDYYWGNINVKNPYIGHLGCNLTCYSMVLSTIDPTLTPGKLNRDKGFYDSWNGPKPSALVNLSQGQIKNAYTTTYDMATWQSELDNGNVIIAHRTSSQVTGHFVLVIDYLADGSFVAYDPARSAIQYITNNEIITDSGHILVKFN